MGEKQPDSVYRHRIGYSGLSNTIYLYRHGKDEALALSKREAEPEVMAAVVERVLDEGGGMTVQFGGRAFTIDVQERPDLAVKLEKKEGEDDG